MNPLDLQTGGDHYKRYAIQPIEYCQRNKLNALEFNIVKYATRHQDKGKENDLLKIKECVDQLLWLHYGVNPLHPIEPELTQLKFEYKRSTIKYGDVLQYTLGDMVAALQEELGEVDTAIMTGDIEGEHGVISELIQVANVALKTASLLRLQKELEPIK